MTYETLYSQFDVEEKSNGASYSEKYYLYKGCRYHLSLHLDISYVKQSSFLLSKFVEDKGWVNYFTFYPNSWTWPPKDFSSAALDKKNVAEKISTRMDDAFYLAIEILGL